MNHVQKWNIFRLICVDDALLWDVEYNLCMPLCSLVHFVYDIEFEVYQVAYSCSSLWPFFTTVPRLVLEIGERGTGFVDVLNFPTLWNFQILSLCAVTSCICYFVYCRFNYVDNATCKIWILLFHMDCG